MGKSPKVPSRARGDENLQAESEAAAVWVERSKLFAWDKNPRKNDGEPVKKVMESIKRFGFASPIIARANGEVIAGHTRLKAAEALGLERVPVRYMDLDPADAALLAIADNKLNEEAEWDAAAVASILSDYSLDDAALVGFDSDDLEKLANELGANAPAELSGESKYTNKIVTPVYEPKGECPEVSTLMDETKKNDLASDILKAKLPRDVEAFLLAAASRHTIFDYRAIAEWYCHAPPNVQRLMERSALVIIDVEKALEEGYVRMSEELGEVFLGAEASRDEDE